MIFDRDLNYIVFMRFSYKAAILNRNIYIIWILPRRMVKWAISRKTMQLIIIRNIIKRVIIGQMGGWMGNYQSDGLVHVAFFKSVHCTFLSIFGCLMGSLSAPVGSHYSLFPSTAL